MNITNSKENIRIIDSNANTVGTYFVVNKGHSATSLKVKIQENLFPDSWLDFASPYYITTNNNVMIGAVTHLF